MIRLKTLLSEAATYPKAVLWARKFQTDLGLTPEAAAAMAANIQHESGFYADRVQGAGIQRDSMAASGNLGYSWAQWTYGPRKKDFRNYVLNKFKVDINKTPATDKQAYAFLKSEIYNYPGFDFNKFKSQTDITKATEQFVSKYEQAGKPMLDDRIAIAQNIYANIKPVAADHGKPIVGQILYPRNRTSANYANVRTSPEVNTGLINNLQVKITWPSPVGKIISTKRDDKMNTWYQVKLMPGIGNGTGLGWVRFDNVTTDKNAKYL